MGIYRPCSLRSIEVSWEFSWYLMILLSWSIWSVVVYRAWQCPIIRSTSNDLQSIPGKKTDKSSKYHHTSQPSTKKYVFSRSFSYWCLVENGRMIQSKTNNHPFPHSPHQQLLSKECSPLGSAVPGFTKWRYVMLFRHSYRGPYPNKHWSLVHHGYPLVNKHSYWKLLFIVDLPH